MNILKTLKLAALTAVLAGSVGMAHAGVACGTAGSGLNTGDVTYSVTGAMPFTDSTNCAGVIMGNINGASDIGTNFGGGFQDAAGTDSGSASASLFGGTFTFSLTGPVNGSTSGIWTLTATDDNGPAVPNFPIFLDFVVALKASDRYALYFFDDATFDGSGGGAWSIQFVNNGNQIPGLSHLGVFVREGSSTSSQSSQSSLTVPEPSSSGLAMLGLGLIGLGFVLRRQSLGR